jgi:hypothetical protein
MLKSVSGKGIEPDGHQCLKKGGMKKIKGVVNLINKKKGNKNSPELSKVILHANF